MSTTAPTDLVALSVETLREGSDYSVAVADVYARLAEAQQVKAGSIIAYLNSDRRRWSEADEAVVRSYLGLTPTPEA